MADAGAESSRLKTLAEERYIAGNLKSALKYAKRAHHLHPLLDGAEELVTALEILLTAAAPISPSPAEASTSADAASLPDYYRILQIERFANINTIKKQYRKLALALHPDKNPFAASEEAFKYVGEGFGVLSDRVRRKEYDAKLRIVMQAEAAAAAGGGGGGVEDTETFLTACSTCRLLHKFDRKYLGHVLVCPSCKKSFEAEEAAGEGEGEETDVSVRCSERCSERIKARRRAGKMVSVVDILARSGGVAVEKDLESVGKKEGLGENKVVMQTRKGAKRLKVAEEDMMTLAEMQAKRLKVAEEGTMTLAEMQKKASAAKLKGKDSKTGMEMGKEKEQDEEVVGEKDIDNTNVEDEEEEMEESREKEMEMEKDQDDQLVDENDIEVENMEEEEEEEEEEYEIDNENVEEEESAEEEEGVENVEKEKRKINGKKRKLGVKKVMMERENRQRKGASNDETSAVIVKASGSNGDLSMERWKRSRRADLQIALTHDSDFYEFDKDRDERSFKKGQVWAIYDSEDGMPRHYGLIDDVVSVDPFEVKLSWLEYESSGDRQLVSRERMGVYVSCGRFKVSEKATVRSLKMFSHIADCERAAREIYRIYPKKGSVWAIYNNKAAAEELCYDIVVFLTNYSDLLGSSMAYLEKVDGLKTTFTRREIGPSAIKFLEKDEFKLLSHEIPGRKLSGAEAPGLPKYCWELDPVALPPGALSGS